MRLTPDQLREAQKLLDRLTSLERLLTYKLDTSHRMQIGVIDGQSRSFMDIDVGLRATVFDMQRKALKQGCAEIIRRLNQLDIAHGRKSDAD